MKPISIQYDGPIEVSTFGTFNMGEYSLGTILEKALKMNKGEFRTMNALVNITIEVKPSQPIIVGGGEEC